MQRTDLCDGDCNRCPIIGHENSRMLTLVLNELRDKYGDGVEYIVNKHCPNMTVCHTCRIDDFCHSEDCDIVGEIPNEKRREW